MDQPTPLTRTVTLCNQRGLHARASAKFIAEGERFDAAITVSRECEGSDCVEATSIMELLMLGAGCGETLTIGATGPDAEAALAALEALVQQGFGELD